jgi:hypothetical protein
MTPAENAYHELGSYTARKLAECSQKDELDSSVLDDIIDQAISCGVLETHSTTWFTLGEVVTDELPENGD